MRAFVFFVFLIQFACSSDVHFLSTSLKTPEGEELTTEFCMPDQVEYLKLSATNRNLRAEQSRLLTEFNRAWGQFKWLVGTGGIS